MKFAAKVSHRSVMASGRGSSSAVCEWSMARLRALLCADGAVLYMGGLGCGALPAASANHNVRKPQNEP